MKHIFISSSVMLLLSVAAASQDYYSGKETVKANSIVYKVMGASEVSALENINNDFIFRNNPYNTERHEYYTAENIPRIPSRGERIDSIVVSILNKHGIYVNDDLWIQIIMAVEPNSKIIKELYFSLFPWKNADILSIRPEVFEEIEKALVGSKYDGKIPPKMLVADYIIIYY